jgi:hypothetical protein
MASINRAERGFLICLTLALACMPGQTRAQQLFTGSGGVVAAEVDKMYLNGLKFLQRTQAAAGNWPDETRGTEPAITALAVVSILAHGDDPNFGPYAKTVHSGLNYILSQMDPATGYIGPSMYNHGFSTLALAESYGAVDDPRLGAALQKAVRLIMSAQEQNPHHAWRYSPEDRTADTTVSGAEMVALLAARNAGIAVPQHVIDDGLAFFRFCQTGDGGEGYTGPTAPNATRTAIGCLVLALAKEKNSPPFRAAFTFLKSAPADAQYPQYFLYYASQAFFHGSPEAWQTWNHQNIESLRASQSPDGNWDSQFGATFATAGSLLSLALNYRYLPVYER